MFTTVIEHDQFEAVAAIPSVVGNAPLATGERKKQQLDSFFQLPVSYLNSLLRYLLRSCLV